jgi:hypothetical protein
MICMIVVLLPRFVRPVASDRQVTEEMTFFPVADIQMAREKFDSYGPLTLRHGGRREKAECVSVWARAIHYIRTGVWLFVRSGVLR